MRVQVFIDGEFQGNMSKAEVEKLIHQYKAKKTYKIEDYGRYINIYNIRRFRRKK